MAYTQSDFNQTALPASSLGLGVVIPAYDQVLKWELISQVLWRQFVDVHPVNPTNNAKVIHLKRNKYLTEAAPTALGEVIPPDVTASPEPIDVPVTILEYGKTMGRTTFLGDVAYVPVDPILAQQIARDLAVSLDLLARATFLTGTNRITANGADDVDAAPAATNTLASTDLLSARALRVAVKNLRKRNVMPWRGENYVAVLSHESALDFMEATGGVPWSAPHINVDTSNLYNGLIGTFAGADIIETNRAFSAADGAAGPPQVNVHRTVVIGREGVAEAVKREPAVGVSPVTDPMNRHRGIYWYGSCGYALYRNEAIERIEHGVKSNAL